MTLIGAIDHCLWMQTSACVSALPVGIDTVLPVHIVSKTQQLWKVFASGKFALGANLKSGGLDNSYISLHKFICVVPKLMAVTIHDCAHINWWRHVQEIMNWFYSLPQFGFKFSWKSCNSHKGFLITSDHKGVCGSPSRGLWCMFRTRLNWEVDGNWTWQGY